MLAADHSCLLCLRSQIDFLLQMISMLLTVLAAKVNTSELYFGCSYHGYPTWLCSVCLAKSPKSKISKYLANLAACTAYCQVGYPWKEHWKCSSEVLTLSSYDRGATLQLEYYAEVVCAPLGRWVGECTFCETRPRPAGPRWIVGMVQF